LIKNSYRRQLTGILQFGTECIPYSCELEQAPIPLGSLRLDRVYMTRSTCRDERVELCCSTSSTQSKCVKCRDEPSGIWGLFTLARCVNNFITQKHPIFAHTIGPQCMNK